MDKFTGDGIMAVFGAPAASEDHAIRACLAALGVQEEAKRVAEEVKDRDGVELRLRVGLNSGQTRQRRDVGPTYPRHPPGHRGRLGHPVQLAGRQ